MNKTSQQVNETKRTPNFTYKEEHLLLEFVEKYKNIIENKKSCSVLWQEKVKAWTHIENSFNAANDGVFRSKQILKQKYANLKKLSKTKLSHNKRELNITGGGDSKQYAITDVDNFIERILGEDQICGLKNNFDSDSVQAHQAGPSNANYIVIGSPDERLSNPKENVEITEYELPEETFTPTIINQTNNENVEMSNRTTDTDDDWSTYSPQMLKKQLNKRLKIGKKKIAYKKFIINELLIKEKLEFVRLQREKFLEEHEIKMKILKLKLQLKEAKMMAPLSPTKISQFRKASIEELLKSKYSTGQWPSSIIHITENPISAVVC